MEEKKLKFCAVQLSSNLGDKGGNFSKVRGILSSIDLREIDVVVFPEVWTVGWKPSLFIDSAEKIENGDTVNFLKEIAIAHNVFIVGGSFITESGGKYFNTCPVISPAGKLISQYSKMHLFSYYGCDEGNFVKKGLNPVIVDIMGVKIGLSICYDIRFPELYRAYRKAGADMLINMAAWPLGRAEHWYSLAKARAIENQCFMLALTQSGDIEGDEKNLGHSMAIDYNGNLLAEIRDVEGAMIFEVKFDEIYDFRNKCRIIEDVREDYGVKI